MHEDIVIIKQEYYWDLASEKVCAVELMTGRHLRKWNSILRTDVLFCNHLS